VVAQGEFEPDHLTLFVGENPFFAVYSVQKADLGRPRRRQIATTLDY
jgi:hypothetical protein